MTNKTKRNKSFLSRYKWWLIGSLIVLFISYIIVYLWFRCDGFIYVGSDLTKSDWLAFFGAFLSFAGTTVISAIAILQSHYFTVKQDERDEKERKKKIQPIFSISIENINHRIFAYTPNIFEPASKSSSCKNFDIGIENVGEYPAFHIIMFDFYKFPVLNSKHKEIITCMYEDSPDAKSTNPSYVHIPVSKYERNENGLPKEFGIYYEDIDGHSMCQIFKLKEFNEKFYYTLSAIEDRL